MLRDQITELVNPTYPKAGKHSAGGKRKRKAVRAARTKQKHRSNPAPLALWLGAVNPEKEKGKMAAKKKKKKATRAANHSKRGSKRNSSVAVTRYKKKKGGKRSYGRNPSFPREIFGYRQPVQIVGMVAGLFGGVTVVKLIPPMLPPSWQASNGTRFALALGTAAVVSIAAGMVLDAPYRDAVIFGALGQASSVALNVFVPKVSSTVNLGDFAPANFPEPHNPLYRKMYRAALMAAGTGTPGGAGAPVSAGVGRYRPRY